MKESVEKHLIQAMVDRTNGLVQLLPEDGTHSMLRQARSALNMWYS
jgi:hypothetical protein